MSSRRPAVTVATVVASQGRFLFVEERVQGRLVINQPAGHLDPGESLVEAAVRETLEETAWHVRVDYLVGVHQWCNPVDQAEVVRFTFAAEPLGHEPGRALDEGIERALWLDLAGLEAARDRWRSPLVERSVRDFLGGARVPLHALSRIAG
jgi:8-oxo-dGTP pyrophosphatase MutT (NUDIX family)